jgi:hypothetical protein
MVEPTKENPSVAEDAKGEPTLYLDDVTGEMVSKK